MVATLQKVYALFLREIAKNSSLAEEVALQGLLKGDYSDRDIQFSYRLRKSGEEIGSVFYHDFINGRHSFYFIPNPCFAELGIERILTIAKELGNGDLNGEELEITLEHVSAIDRNKKEESKISDEIYNTHVGIISNAFRRSPKRRKCKI